MFTIWFRVVLAPLKLGRCHLLFLIAHLQYAFRIQVPQTLSSAGTCQTAGLLFSAAYRIAFCPQEEKNYDAGQRNFLIDDFRLSASNVLNTPWYGCARCVAWAEAGVH
jgi:hypothetical protein